MDDFQMHHKLRNDILNYLKGKGERGATLSLITLDIRSRYIEESVERSVNEIADAIHSLVEARLVEVENKRLRKHEDTIYKLRSSH